MMKRYQRIKFQTVGREGGHLKKSWPHAIKAWGPSRTLASKPFKESCLNTSIHIFFYSKANLNASLLQYQQLSGNCAKVC